VLPFFSADDGRAAVLAVGISPVGIVAIGVTPVGVVAIGCGAAAGGITVTCGVGVGLATFVSGLGVGVLARGVGFVYGVKTGKSGVSVVPGGYPRASRETAKRMVSLSELREPGVEGWIDVEVALDGGKPALRHKGRDVDASFSADVAARLVALAGSRARVRLRAVVAPAGEAEGYREASVRTELACVEVEPRAAASGESRAGALFWWWTKLVLRGVPWAAAMIGGACLATARVEAAIQPSLAHVVEVTWNATVRKSEGIAIAPDARCTVHGVFDGDGVDRIVARVVVVCGSMTLFEGSNMQQCRLNEAPGTAGPGSYDYGLVCHQDEVSDKGVIAGMPGLDLDTHPPRREVIVDTAPPHRTHVELVVDETATRTGEPLAIGNLPRDPGFVEARRHGTVTRTSGASPVETGSTCEVDVLPVWSAKNCVVHVVCAEKIIYGEGRLGHSTCAVSGRAPTRASDVNGVLEDHDPKLEMDLPKGSVVVSDVGYEVDVAVDP
jgi:hypothetical protein